ncbi:MAG: MFS transporter, partial [Alphaproteobacteria bacterium]|nr:MFS transporter [Alphaproteobacteria bacterium]
IGSAYYAGFVAGCLGIPRLLTRIGHIRTFAIAGGAAAATVLLQSMFVGQLLWIFARLVFGFAAAGIYMVTESWLNDRATNDTRGRILAIYLTVNYGGIVVGQWVYTAASPLSFVLFNIAAIFYALCLVPVGATRLPQPVPSDAPAIRPWRLFRIAPVGIAGCIAVGAANGAVWTLAPVYANVHGLHDVMLAAFMSAFTAAGALTQAPVGRLSDHMDRRWAIVVMSFLAGLAAAALALFGGLAPYVAIGLFALFGAAALPIYGLSVAHTNDRIPREEFVSASATLLLVNALASVIGPIAAAEITTHTTIAALFWFVAAIHGVHVLFVIWRMNRAERPPEVYREPYAPVLPHTTPTALELDPRGPQSAE